MAWVFFGLTACEANNRVLDGRAEVGNVPYDTSAATTLPASPITTTGDLGTHALSNCAPSVPVTPLQRLTKQQYANSVAALLNLPVSGINLRGLPQDETVGPFAVNTQIAVGDLASAQYQDAAIAYATQAMGDLNALLPCAPDNLTAACTQKFIMQFGQKAFRRDLTSDEVTRYTSLTSGGAANDPNAVRLVIQAFLQSPYFLYRPEFGDPNTADQETIALTPYEQATRLALFLWNGGPDNTLLQAASDGSLSDPNFQAAQIDRMLADERVNGSAATYVSTLLEIEGFDGVQKDPNSYPQYTPELQAALLQETQTFVALVMSGDATVKTLLTSSETVPTNSLLSYYGVTAPADYVSGSGTVSLSGAQRGGILTRGAFLAIHGHSNASGPVPRGRIVRENMLCQKMPAPPPGVSLVPPAPIPGSTTRQLLLAHEKIPSCAACHVLMDHIGFGFEHFDGVGAWRQTDGGHPVDATGNIVATAATNVAFDGAEDLSAQLAASSDVSNCMVLQMFRYGMARPETTADACTLAKLKASFSQSDGSLRTLMKGLAQTQAFTRLRVNP